MVQWKTGTPSPYFIWRTRRKIVRQYGEGEIFMPSRGRFPQARWAGFTAHEYSVSEGIARVIGAIITCKRYIVVLFMAIWSLLFYWVSSIL
jgi:hypothetical protein